jgi:hypothetical protein
MVISRLFWVVLLSHILPCVMASPAGILPRKSESERVSELCVEAIEAFKPDKYYLSHTEISKSTTVGGSRVGPKVLICTAYYECKTADYLDYIQGVFLRVPYVCSKFIWKSIQEMVVLTTYL